MTFTATERAAVAEALRTEGDSDNGRHPLATLLAKMDRASAPAGAEPGLGVKRFEEIARSRLGSLLAVPDRASPGWYARIARTLRDTGVTEDDALAAASNVVGWAKHSVGLEYLAQRAVQLAADYRRAGGSPAGGGGGPQIGRVPEWEE